ncbi:MAG: hypothetical protein KDM64_13180, partial [Verrucomicrobiae bacterium]|nr:hypothetical protein [Verrucomicrobiae bacterium]
MKLGTRSRNIALLCLCVVSLVCGNSCGEKTTEPAAQESDSSTAAWKDESFYIVNMISRALLRFCVLGVGEIGEDQIPQMEIRESEESRQNAPVYVVDLRQSGRNLSVELRPDFETPIWSPALYRSVAESCAALTGLSFGEKISVENDDSNSALVARLTEASSEDLVDLSSEISSRLVNDFTNSGAHIEAAVLLGAFGLEDFSGDFLNLRPVLNRMTAHLAFAELTRGASSGASPDSRKLAEALLNTLMNRQILALGLVDSLPESMPYAAWRRVLRARVTGDFRELEDMAGGGLTPVEYTAWFEARCRSASPETSWEKAEKTEENAYKLIRIVSRTSPSIEVGHVLLRASIPMEIDQLQRVYKSHHGRDLDEGDFVSALNADPDEPHSASVEGFRVLEWGIWADFLQRHLANAMAVSVYFADEQWGAPEAARKVRRSIDGTFSGLVLYPFVMRRACLDDEEYRQSVEDGFTLAGQIPQRIPAKCWARLYYFHGGAGRRHVPKHADRADFSTWLFHNPPPGTVYNVDARTGAFSMTKIPEAGERFATLNQFAPWEVSLVEAMINGRFSGEVGYEERLTLYQSVAEYSLIPNTSLAELVRDQPGRYEFHTLRAAKLDPYFFLPMAAYFESVDEEKAQKYYEIGIAQCPDRVAVSKYCGW